MEAFLAGLAVKLAPSLLSALAEYPFARTVISDIVGSLKVTTAPPTPPPPPTGTVAHPGQTGPSEFVKSIQSWLNTNAPPAVPLKVDGWLGPKTEAAMKSLLARYGMSL